jgi:UDP-N-acetylglucosamine/UDP-N-acetylgalactosamine diphosphorylase
MESFSSVLESKTFLVVSNGPTISSRCIFCCLFSICNHYFTVPFLRRVATAYKEEPSLLPYHIAIKKIPCAHLETGDTVAALEPNGIKLEAFIFDSFPLASASAILEVSREDEFAPVKNECGSASDSPDTAKEALMDMHRRWAISAGGLFSHEALSSPFEISPLVSYEGEGLSDLCSQRLFGVGDSLL